MTIREWAGTWLELRRAKLAPRTVEQYQDFLRRYILPVVGDVELTNLTPLNVARVVAGAGEHERTAQLCYVILSAMMRSAYRMGLIDTNPCDRIEKPRHVSRITSWWTSDELREFLRADADDPLILAWLLGALCGLRRGELCGLRWCDISGDTMHICNQRVRINGTVCDRPTKTRTSDRWLPITPVIRWYLDDQRDRYPDAVYVLTDRRGAALEPSRLDRAFRNAQRRAGMDKLITLHGLRHTMASVAVAAGINPRELQPALGHASYTTTANIYTHIQQRQLNGAVMAITRAVFVDVT